MHVFFDVSLPLSIQITIVVRIVYYSQVVHTKWQIVMHASRLLLIED
jgi:hypothetical protein